jgi:hypothetical protein
MGFHTHYRDSFTVAIGLKKMKLSLCLIKHLNMKTEGEVEAQHDTYLTSSAAANEYLDSSLVRFSPGEGSLSSIV